MQGGLVTRKLSVRPSAYVRPSVKRVPENAMLHANHVSICYTASYERSKFTLREWAFWTYWLLWSWPWSHELHIRTSPALFGGTPYVQIESCDKKRLILKSIIILY